jgi:hypothetical protein
VIDLCSCCIAQITTISFDRIILSLLSVCLLLLHPQAERIRGLQSRLERCRALAAANDPKSADAAIPLLSSMVKTDVCRAVEPYALLVEAYLLTSRADKADEASKYVVEMRALIRTCKETRV